MIKILLLSKIEKAPSSGKILLAPTKIAAGIFFTSWNAVEKLGEVGILLQNFNYNNLQLSWQKFWKFKE